LPAVRRKSAASPPHRRDPGLGIWQPLRRAPSGRGLPASPSRTLLLDPLSAGVTAPGALDRLRISVGTVREMLDEHADDENQQILPAMRRYLSAGGYRWYERQVRRNTPLSRLRFSVPWLAGYAQPDPGGEDSAP
jgi:hypothetical protein